MFSAVISETFNYSNLMEDS